MNLVMKYDGERGSLELLDGIWHGKILNTTDLVTYEAETMPLLRDAFRDAVIDWRETRKQLSEPNCCSKPIVENSDLCSGCLEHCEPGGYE